MPVSIPPHVTNHNYTHSKPFSPLNTDSESVLQPHDLRRYFNVKLCKSSRKVTRQASASLVTTEAQNVYNKIMQKMGAGDYGDESENDSSWSENEIKDEDDNCDPDGSDYSNDSSASQEIAAYSQGNNYLSSRPSSARGCQMRMIMPEGKSLFEFLDFSPPA